MQGANNYIGLTAALSVSTKPLSVAPVVAAAAVVSPVAAEEVVVTAAAVAVATVVETATEAEAVDTTEVAATEDKVVATAAVAEVRARSHPTLLKIYANISQATVAAKVATAVRTNLAAVVVAGRVIPRARTAFSFFDLALLMISDDWSGIQ